MFRQRPRPFDEQRAELQRDDLRLTERDLADFQRELASLKPVSQLDRDELLFRAGQASMRRHAGWFWRASTAALALCCAGLTAVLLLREPRVIHGVEYINISDAPESIRDGARTGIPSEASAVQPVDAPAPAYEVRGLPGDYFRYRQSLATFSPVAPEFLPRPALEQQAPVARPAAAQNYLNIRNKLLESLLPIP